MIRSGHSRPNVPAKALSAWSVVEGLMMGDAKPCSCRLDQQVVGDVILVGIATS